MSDYQEMLTKSFWGYNVSQVDIYMAKLEQRQKELKNSLYQQLSSILQEKESLVHDLFELENEQRELLKTKDIMEIARETTGKIVAHIHSLADLEKEHVLREAREKASLHQKAAEAVKGEIFRRAAAIDQAIKGQSPAAAAANKQQPVRESSVDQPAAEQEQSLLDMETMGQNGSRASKLVNMIRGIEENNG